MADPLDPDEAAGLDASDAVASRRSEYAVPAGVDGEPVAYLAGNSLGLQAHRSRAAVERVLDSWSRHAVGGHFLGDESWYRYDEAVAELHAPLVGAAAHEVAMMGSLTANLHVLMASFYRPTTARPAILIEPHAFPSDRYAAESQIAWHGGDPHRDLITVEPAHPDRVTIDDLDHTLARHGDRIALALVGGVNYLTGQLLDLAAWVERLRGHDIAVGLDLAHAAGNVPLALHDLGCDFAAWCTYKYLNGGPGSTSGIFVHDRHHHDLTLPRLGGWWGNDPDTRFDMHGQEHFVPRRTVDGWKASNPSILAMAPVRGSLEVFAEVGMDALRARSMRLTAHLEAGLDAIGADIVTPRDPGARGCQLSVRVSVDAAALQESLAERGVVVDARDPDIIRLAPTPLYSTFADNTRAVRALAELLPPR